MTDFPHLFTKEIEDQFVQDNFKKIETFMREFPFAVINMDFYEIIFAGPFTNYKHKHSLNFTPKDVIMTHNLNNATVTFNYSLFDSVNIDLTVSAATTIRFLLGRFENG
jgi:hypothetical protein